MSYLKGMKEKLAFLGERRNWRLAGTLIGAKIESKAERHTQTDKGQRESETERERECVGLPFSVFQLCVLLC